MVQQQVGNLDGAGHRIAIAATRFNGPIVDHLIDGALDGLLRNGVDEAAVSIARCPGSWELPLLCQRLAAKGDVDAVIALGAIIRGETPHYDYLANECVKGLAQVQHAVDKPVVFGVLTTDTVDQAMNRAGIKMGNKGFDCALAVIEMCNLLGEL